MHVFSVLRRWEEGKGRTVGERYDLNLFNVETESGEKNEKMEGNSGPMI